MYSIVDPDAVRLITDDFTLRISRITTEANIMSTTVVLRHLGKRIIITDTKKRAFSYWDCYHTFGTMFITPWDVCGNIIHTLPEYNRCVPRPEQTIIMGILGTMLY
jgi:hypothetical protein